MKNWLFLLLIFVTGCSSRQDEKSYAEDMMISDKCSKACWLGIEPGMTLDPEAVYNILSNHYGSENVYYSENGARVGWYISSSPVFSESCSIYIIDTEQVKSMQIILQDNQIPIDDLVALFGSPEVTINRNKNEEAGFPPCGLWQLAYPQIGLGIIVDSTQGINYVDMMYIAEPYSASEMQISEEREFATKESIISWDEREKYCTSTQPASP